MKHVAFAMVTFVAICSPVLADGGRSSSSTTFMLVDRKCQRQYASPEGILQGSRPGDLTIMSCIRKGKDVRCSVTGQDPKTTFGDGAKTTQLDLNVFFEEGDVTIAKSSAPAANAVLFVYWSSAAFVWAETNVTSELAVIQKQCTGEVARVPPPK